MNNYTPHRRFNSPEPIYVVGEQNRKPPARRDTDTLYIAVISDSRDVYCSMIRAFRTEAGARRWAKEITDEIRQKRNLTFHVDIIEQLGGLSD